MVLILGAAVVIGIAIAQFVIAWKASFMEQMPRCPGLVRPIGRFGHAARALVIGMVGWFLFRAGLEGERVRNFGDALALLKADHDWLFLAVAAGLVAFGFTSLMMARYRRIEDRDVVDDLERGVEKAKLPSKADDVMRQRRTGRCGGYVRSSTAPGRWVAVIPPSSHRRHLP